MEESKKSGGKNKKIINKKDTLIDKFINIKNHYKTISINKFYIFTCQLMYLNNNKII